MQRTHTIRLILATLTSATLLVVAIELSGAENLSAEQTNVVRLPRPHPTTHLSYPPGIDLLNPRPHPHSHLKP